MWSVGSALFLVPIIYFLSSGVLAIGHLWQGYFSQGFLLEEGASASGSETEDLGKTAAKALATTAETEGELGGPEDPIADIVSLGLGLGTLFGGLGGVEHQKLPTYRQPINPSVVYGI